HAAAKKENYAEARDLYKQLSDIEPENVLHSQNYKQMLAKLGEDSATRILTPEEAAQAFMVEELDETAPSVHQSYDPPTEKAIESALTDAELYVSYNVPSKAIPPLEAALPLAPQDVNLNQRLASLYVRAERFGDAARMYQNLSEIYSELGHPTESAKYLEASKRYALRAPQSAAPPPAMAEPAKAPKATWPPEHTAAASEPIAQAPAEIEAEPSVQEFSFDHHDAMPAEPGPIVAMRVEPTLPEPAASEITLEPFQLESSSVAAVPPAAPAQEIDISNEWEEMIEVEPAETEPEAPVMIAHEQVTENQSPVREVELEPAAPVEPAPAALESQVADKVQEIRFYITQKMWEPAKSAILDLTELAPDAPEVTELIAAVSAGQAQSVSPAAVEPIPVSAVEPIPVSIDEPPVMPVPAEVPPPKITEPAPRVHQGQRKPIDEPAPAMAQEDILDIPEPPKAKPSAQRPAATAQAKSTEDILGDFVLDLEQTDLADFVPKQQSAKAPVPSAAPAPAPAPAMERRTNGSMQEAETGDVLSDILSELREETAEAAEPEEDPETHYNLGIAFKEMGLLDEAIGELQKVCHAIDRSIPFSQPIQALTWLAQCLVDKGAPEAAVRWYQKALQLPGLDDGNRCAIYYDLAMAYDAAGDKKSALANFMEVYGSNIDFRDVASRIKALKS
ncbi:MAG: hypothetical protein WA738_02350, partial [Candidatus Angelobacter sp.]